MRDVFLWILTRLPYATGAYDGRKLSGRQVSVGSIPIKPWRRAVSGFRFYVELLAYHIVARPMGRPAQRSDSL